MLDIFKVLPRPDSIEDQNRLLNLMVDEMPVEYNRDLNSAEITTRIRYVEIRDSLNYMQFSIYRKNKVSWKNEIEKYLKSQGFIK